MARNQQSIYWNIEELRSEFYSAYTDPNYFRRHIAEVASRHPELQVEGRVVRLTPQGLDHCVSWLAKGLLALILPTHCLGNLVESSPVLVAKYDT